MIRLLIVTLTLLLVSGFTGCMDDIIPDDINMTHSSAGDLAKVEVIGAYCLNTEASKFPFRFILQNLTDEALQVEYYWSLNDPMREFPEYYNKGSTLSRVHQGRGEVVLPPMGADLVQLNLKLIMEYDPRSYVMYVSVYSDGSQIGWYREQKSAGVWDYSVIPPVKSELNSSEDPPE